MHKAYEDAGKAAEYRARFDGLYVFSKDGAGYGKEKSWKMDVDGCNPISANLNNPMDSEDECRIYLKSFASGGTIYPHLPSRISKEKFCDGKISSAKLGAISHLSDCLESYPQLRDMDREKPKPGARSSHSTSPVDRSR